MLEPGFLFVQFLTGLASASNLFLIACGLSLIFGVTRIVNFAHGSLYMLGAYFAVTTVEPLQDLLGPSVGFWGAVAVAALGAGVCGILIEILLLRRIYKAPELFQLLATFGIVLVVQDMVIHVFGPEDILGPRAPDLRGAVTIFGQRFPEYELLMIAAGPAVLGVLWLIFNRTRWGTLVRAATHDREMVGALGVNQGQLFTGILFLGALLAGLAGALQMPREPANPYMDVNIIAEAFVVTVIGGMGNILGAFLAALLIGLLQAFGILVFPKITLVLVFLVMAIVLVIRPWGLLGKPEPVKSHGFGREHPLRLGGPRHHWAWTGVVLLLILIPSVADEYTLRLLIEVLIFSLFALSLNFIMGSGGMVSFGHAAYFGVGAYGAALAVKHFGVTMEPAMLAAPIAGGVAAFLFGWFIVRLSGVYLAMLTLAFAQITWSIAFQWVEVTGGDNGLIGIWPSPWAADALAYYYLTLVVCCAGIWFLRRALYAPFGYTLRAGRDSPLRADAIGIDLRTHQWLAFTLAGTAAGLAGGLLVFSKGNLDPGVLSIPTSVDGLVMVLIGGIQTLTGPLVGGAVFSLLEAYIIPLTDYWRAILGLFIITLVLLFPLGIVGFLQERFNREPGEAEAATAKEAGQ